MHIPAVASLWASLPDAPLDAPPAEFSHAPLQLTRGLACGGIQRTYEAECGGKTDKKRAKRQKKKEKQQAKKQGDAGAGVGAGRPPAGGPSTAGGNGGGDSAGDSSDGERGPDLD